MGSTFVVSPISLAAAFEDGGCTTYVSRKKQRLPKTFLEDLLTVSCRCDCQVPVARAGKMIMTLWQPAAVLRVLLSTESTHAHFFQMVYSNIPSIIWAGHILHEENLSFLVDTKMQLQAGQTYRHDKMLGSVRLRVQVIILRVVSKGRIATARCSARATSRCS
jgi:hypothetical protein